MSDFPDVVQVLNYMEIRGHQGSATGEPVGGPGWDEQSAGPLLRHLSRVGFELVRKEAPPEPAPENERAKALKCIVCESWLNLLHPDSDAVQGQTIPMLGNGVACRTTGNYGSKVYDPAGPEFLQFALCDGCLVERAGTIRRVVWKEPPRSSSVTVKEHSFADRLREERGGSA